MSAATIIPRWEWRCFAPSLTTLVHAVSIPADAAPRESDETYILDLKGRNSENVKIRDGVLNVKRLLQTDSEGLELWEPVLKARFPLSRKDVAVVFGHWMPPLAAWSRESYTFEQFVEDIVAPRPTLRVVDVHKVRRGFTFAGCLAELARIRVESVSIQSFSLEHEDRKRLLTAIDMLGLDARANTNYILGLKHALGLDTRLRN
jgi:exopolyphosphatase / guanosine-5'-triphosphate,3'-diphosphate pyrophosphatase